MKSRIRIEARLAVARHGRARHDVAWQGWTRPDLVRLAVAGRGEAWGRRAWT